MYIVKYSGPFGFIKPWTAVRDDQTFSQQFLTPSIIEGIEKKLFPSLLTEVGIKKIIRHRLTFSNYSTQQEQTQARGINPQKKKTVKTELQRNKSIIKRCVLINPALILAFNNCEDAEIAKSQHICLCRNEDVLLPSNHILRISEEEFDCDVNQFRGFELIFENNEESFLVGFNRYNDSNAMYGRIAIFGDNPLICREDL